MHRGQGSSETPPLLDQILDRDTPGEFYARAVRDGVKDLFQGPPTLGGHRNQARLVPMPAERGRTLKEIFDSITNRPRIKLPSGARIKKLIEEGRRF